MSRYDPIVSRLLIGEKIQIKEHLIKGLRSAFYRTVNNASAAGVDLGKKLKVQHVSGTVDDYIVQAVKQPVISFSVVEDTQENPDA